MDNDVTDMYPSARFQKRPRTRVAPLVVTVIVLIVTLLLIYLLIVWLESRTVDCSGPPEQPQNVIAGYIDRRTFGIAWDKPANADSYIVRIGELRNFGPDEAIIQIETKDRAVNVANLQLSRTYYIVVTAVNKCGNSPDSLSITYVFVET